MRKMRWRMLSAVAMVVVVMVGLMALPSRAVAGDVRASVSGVCSTASSDAPYNAYKFGLLRDRTDKLVDQGVVSRGQTWGLSGTVAMYEGYKESPGGTRAVRYYDKSRMEINNSDGESESKWYVTNGLLVNEMITGKMQYGDNTFSDMGGGAKVPFVGDLDNGAGTYYSDLAPVYHKKAGYVVGSIPTTTLSGTTNTGYFYDRATWIGALDHGYGIPQAFVDFMKTSGPVLNRYGVQITEPLYPDPLVVFGLPTTESYWVQAKVGGVTKLVLVQAFERRILTYTPTNSPEWRVEMGNVGLHYGTWRYGTNFTPERTPQIIITGYPNRQIGGTAQIVSGCSWIRPFENTLSVRVLAPNELGDAITVMGTGTVTVSETPNAASGYEFSGKVNYTLPKAITEGYTKISTGYIEVAYFSPKDGAKVVVSRTYIIIVAAPYMIVRSPLYGSALPAGNTISFSGVGTIPFERVYGVRLVNGYNYQVLAQKSMMFGPSGDLGTEAPFSGTITYNGEWPGQVYLDVFVLSAKGDGSFTTIHRVLLCRDGCDR